MKQAQNFTEGRILSPLLRFMLPVLAAQFIQAMYGAVDLMVVGQFGGEMSDVYVSAVSTGSQLMMTLTVIIGGLAMGLTVFIGRMIGAGSRDEAGKIVGAGIFLFGVISVVLTAVCTAAARPIAQLMQAPAEALSSTVTYLSICFAGTVFIVAYNLVGSIFRGIGDSKMPLITVIIACVVNILGDLLLVAVFDMGAAGAAIATVSAQAISVIISLVIIRRRPLPFDFSLKFIRPIGAHIREILRLGVPISLQDLLVSFSFLVLLAIVNSLGLTASAGVGVAEKLSMFIMLLPSSYMQAMSAFVAQNIGAKKPARARRALLCGIATSLAAGVVMFAVTFFCGDLLAGIFARDADVIAAAFAYLRAYAVDCLLVGFLFCFIGYFNGCGNTTFVMLQGLVGAFGVRIPVAWLMSRIAGGDLFRLGLSTPASTVVQIVLCLAFFAVQLRRERRTAV